MPIADTYVPLKSSGNGSTQDFSFNFYIGSTANLRVYEEDDTTKVQTLKTLGVDYTATFNDDTPGGNVHFLVAPASGKSIIRARSIPKTQETPLKTSSGFQATVVQTIVDKLTALVQDVYEQISRAVKLPLGTSITSVTLPEPQNRRSPVWIGTTGTMANSTYDPDEQVVLASAAAASATASALAAATAKTNAETAETNAEAAQSAAEAAAAAIPAKASQAEAEAGVVDNVYMTPLKTAQAIAALADVGIKSDGSVGIANLIYNGRFDYWLAGTTVAPTEWTADVNGGTIAQDGTYFKLGTYSMKLISPAGDTAAAYQYVGDYVALRGRKVTLSCWVKCSSASKAFIRLGDSDSYTDSAYHTGGGNWELLTVTRTINAAATNVYARPVVGSGSITAYFDGVMMTEGESILAYSPAPLKHGAWISRTSGTVYYASCDGHVVGCRNSSGDAVSINVKTDADNPPATIRQNTVKMADESIGHLSCPIKKGDYWNADNCTGAAGFLYFIPWVN